MYGKKIKIFKDTYYEHLERDVNSFLAKEVELGFTILDIKYQMSSAPNEEHFSCLIYYTEPVKEN